MAIEKQAKVTTLIFCVKQENNVQKYLIQQRLKQPRHGFYGFFGGKISWGETAQETATRELSEETGLKGDLKLVLNKHKMDYTQGGQLLEDKFFFGFRAVDLTSELVQEFEGGRNLWLSKDSILKIPCLF